METKLRTLPEFNPTNPQTCAKEWEIYKRNFLIHLDALGLDDKPGRRKVGVLLANMGAEAVKIYDSFTYAPAVEENVELGIEARNAESKHNLDTVFSKFDRHFGVHSYRNIKRQEFLNTKRGNNSVMDYISELKRKAEFCDYGDQREGLVCDMIINGVNDRKCTEKLMELSPENLTLEKVIQVCRQVELTNAHIESLSQGQENPSVNYTRSRPATVRNRSTHSNNAKSGYQGNHPYCNKCLKHHAYRNCPAFNKNCDSCGQRGHFKGSVVCKSRGSQSTHRSQQGRPRFTSNFRGRQFGYGRGAARNRRHNVHYVDDTSLESHEEPFEDLFDQCSIKEVFTAKTQRYDENEWSVTFDVNGKKLSLEIDSGALCNVITKVTADKFATYANRSIQHSDTIIYGISGTKIKSVGKLSLPCGYLDTVENLTFQVIDSPQRIHLLGRSDSSRLGLIARINSAETHETTEEILKQYSDVVGDLIGLLPGEYDIKIDESVNPVVHAPRALPVAMREQVKHELDHLEKCGIIAPVLEPTKWVSSMVCVRKKNGRVRICIDPTDLNKAILREHFPMNTIEDVATRLHGSKVFSTLDANMGYYQIKLTEKSSLLTTFNTPFGRYRYLRMPMGLKCAAEVFQREMINQFGNLSGVEVVIDDILVHGSTPQVHNARLKAVLQKARLINLKLNKAKCVIGKNEVNYVGHQLTGHGLKPTSDRVRAITEMRDPENHAELDTILGMLAYVSKFIPNLSELNAPLRTLKTQTEWNWSTEEKQTFENVKSALTSTEVLRYFDPKGHVKLSVDASTKGLGAAIIQQHGVVAYASRALTPAEQRYAQIEKEMLAVVFGCQKFHKLLYGKHDVTIESDHKPLETILKKPIHSAPMRIQKMILKLQPYEFNLVYKKGAEIGLADCLSRLPLQDETHEQCIDDEMMVFKVETLANVSHNDIALATRHDEQLQILKQVICQGWPDRKSEVPVDVMPFWDCRDELSTYNGIVYRGERIVIPSSLRGATLKVIHSSHLGMLRCKQRARELVYWPGMNQQIEDIVSKCSACLKYRSNQQKEPMIIHPIPTLPWSKVGSDIFELNGLYYLILVDYFSNFIEVAPLQRNMTSANVIKRMKENIARYGIMDTLVSDNGPQYASEEFRAFTTQYGIQHLTSSPLYPQSNGLAEKAVQTVKNVIKKCSEDGSDIYISLLELRNTPRDSEIGSPAQRLMGRRTKTLIPMSSNLRKPGAIDTHLVNSRLFEMRQTQKHYYDRNAKPRDTIKPSDAVRIKSPEGWKPAEYVQQSLIGPRSYVVKAGNHNRVYRRNSQMLLKTKEEPHRIDWSPEQESFQYIYKPSKAQVQASGDSFPNKSCAKSNSNEYSSANVREYSGVNSKENSSANSKEYSDVNSKEYSSANSQECASANSFPKEYSRSGRQIKVPKRFSDFVRN